MKLFDDLKKCKGKRKKYKIKFSICFHVDNDDYIFSFLPTIVWTPWVYRNPIDEAVVDIWWLHFHILIGKWIYKPNDILICDDLIKPKIYKTLLKWFRGFTG